MSGKELPQPHKDGYGFTENERLFYRVSHKRFRELFDDPETTIHRIELAHNSYGEFLFITASRETEQGSNPVTFYGQGFHEHRERWITNVWFWYQANKYPATMARTVSKLEAEELLKHREEEVAAWADSDQQSERGRLFEMLADLTDDDGAIAEMEDLDNWFGDLGDF